MKHPDAHLMLLVAAVADVCAKTAPVEIQRRFKRAERFEVSFAIEGIGLQFRFWFKKAPWKTARAGFVGDTKTILWEWGEHAELSKVQSSGRVPKSR